MDSRVSSILNTFLSPFVANTEVTTPANAPTATPGAPPVASTFTGTPSLMTKVSVLALHVVRLVKDVTGVDLVSPLTGLIVSTSPPVLYDGRTHRREH